MSRSVDERVVDMQLENAQFEAGAKTSLSTIEKLKESLNFSGAEKGLDNLESSIHKIDLSGLSGAAETIQSKFSAMEIMAITALSNITNSAVNAGKKIISAFTVDPIYSGFQEYETQINAVQTILANTQSRQAEVSKAAVQEINETAQAAAVAAELANKQSLERLKENQQNALESVKDTQSKELKEHSKKLKEQEDELEDSYKTRLKELEQYVDAELDVLEERYSQESEALQNAINEENRLLKEAHNEKLDLYHEEYLEKLRLIDEDRYNRLKAIDDEIARINGLTKAEDEALREEKERKKLQELESAVYNAKDTEARLKAEERLDEYRKELERNQVLRERKSRIEELQASKNTIQEEYKLQKEQIQSEYEASKNAENELYQLELDNLKTYQAEKKKEIQDTYNSEKKLLLEIRDSEKELLKNEYANQKELLKETYEEEKELLQAKHKAELKAIKDSQKAELAAMESNHTYALQNIENEKNARIKALNASAGMTKGSTLEDVKRALDELNLYADKTIYNFTEMTRNIGTFTAAGIDLDTSVAAIKGIANLAAVSGSTSQQASTAMYQLSQALASGTVKLQDWNSVVNAGMGGQVFQDSLKETARVHKIAVDEMISSEGSFRESLKHGWLTAEILTETLSKFTGDLTEAQLKEMGYTEEQIASIIKMGNMANDAATKVKTFTQLWDTLNEAAQSGWTQSWEIIIGDFEEAKELLTEISDIFSDIIGSSADARNEVLQGWKDLGGRTVLIASFKNLFDGVISIVTPLKEAFYDIFPPITAQHLAKFTSALRELTSHFIISDETADKLKRSCKGLFSILDIIGQAFLAVTDVIKPLIGGFDGFGESLLDNTARLGDWLVGIDNTIRETNIFRDSIQKVEIFFKTAFSRIVEIAANALRILKEKFKEPIFETFHSILDRVQNRMHQIGNAADKMKSIVILAFEAMGKALEKCDFIRFLGVVWILTQKLTSGVLDALSTIFGNLAQKLSSIKFSGILDLFNMLLSGGIFVMIKKAADGLGEVTDIFGGVKDCLEAFQNDLQAGTLVKIATAVGILAASILAISWIDSSKLTESLLTITTLFAELMASMEVYGKTSGNRKGITAMIGIATSVLVLSGALVKVSEIDSEKIAQGLIGVGVLLAEILGFMEILSLTSTKSIKGGFGMIMIAAAVKILASACEDLSKFNWDELAKGLSGVGGFLLEIAAFAKLMGGAKHTVSSGLAIIEIAAGLKILASAFHDFSGYSWDEIAHGLVAMAGALAEITLAVNLMPSNMLGAGTGLIAIATALVILAEALRKMGDMQWESIAKGLTAMGGSMAILAVGLNAMKGTLAGSAAMLTAAASLAVLTPSLFVLGSMTWEAIAKGLTAIAGAFAVMGVAGLVLAPIVPAILGLSGALALVGVSALGIGAGLALAGAGLTAMAVGIGALAAAGTAGAAAVVASVTVIITGLADLIPTLIQKFGEGLVAFCNVIANSAEAIGGAIKAVILNLVSVFTECIPAIVNGALVLIETVLDVLASDHASKIVDSILTFVIALLNGVARKTPELIGAITNVITSLFSGVIDVLKSMDTQKLIHTIEGIGLMSGLMLALSAVSATIPGAMAGVLGMGGVIAELALVLAAVGALGQIPGLNWLIEEGGNVLEGIGNAIGSFVGGIVGGILEGITSSLPGIANDLSDFMRNLTPFLEGAKGVDANTLEGVKSLAHIILLLTAADILNGLTSWFTGGTSIANFGKELAAFGPYLARYSESVKGIGPDVVQASANAVRILSDMAKKLPNQGGIVSWFTGDNRLSVFGKELAAFGPSLRKYSDSVTGIDAKVVAASTNAATALSELASNLPNQGGIVSWFTGDNTISAFGDGLADFGKSMSKYYNHVSNIKPSILTATTDSLKSLVDILAGMSNVPVKGAENFTKSLGNLAKAGIDEFTKKYKDSEKTLSKTASDMITKFIDGLQSKKDTLAKAMKTFGEDAAKALQEKKDAFTASAKTLIAAINDGVKSQGDSIHKTFQDILTTVLQKIADKKNDFANTAKALLDAFLKKVEDSKETISASFVKVVTNANEAIKKLQSDFENSGKLSVEGFAKGISKNSDKAEKEAQKMAKASLKAINDTLDIRSPSRETYASGEYAGKGFVNALHKYISIVYSEGTAIADAAIEGMEQAITYITDFLSSDLNEDPTIRPVLDLSDVEKGSAQIYGMLNDIDGYAISGSAGLANSISHTMGRSNLIANENSMIDKLNDRISKLENAPSVTFHNVFNGVNGDPEEIAERVSNIMHKQLMRKENAWA